MSPPIELPAPFIELGAARRLARMVAGLPRPVVVDDGPPTDDFAGGFDEAKDLAVALILAAGASEKPVDEPVPDDGEGFGDGIL